jgi:hypothetical protein
MQAAAPAWAKSAAFSSSTQHEIDRLHFFAQPSQLDVDRLAVPVTCPIVSDFATACRRACITIIAVAIAHLFFSVNNLSQIALAIVK